MRMSESRIVPSFDLEAAEMALGGGPVVGIDEAGRGPWAGPVVAAAVILDPQRIPQGIDDSKMLDAEERERLYLRITATALAIGVGIGDVDRIDRDNILAATLWAMSDAMGRLTLKPKLAIIDGNQAPRLACTTRTIVNGDAKCLSIAAASIVAKVTRDRLMIKLGAELPGYGFERHKGYGTPEHRSALKKLGVTPYHRRSFKPVQLALGLAEPSDAKALEAELSSTAS
jgi:ribonuclease HII